jgi:Ca2+-binding EF-hand superfamily protein
MIYEWRREHDFPRNLATISDMRALFEKFDMNNDGYLSRGEFLQLVTHSESERVHDITHI